MSTEPRPTPAFDPDRSYRLNPRVALRHESFGALAYHYGNRRLNFLRSPDLVAVVESLDRHVSPRVAFGAVGVAAERWPGFEHALAQLAAADVLEAV